MTQTLRKSGKVLNSSSRRMTSHGTLKEIFFEGESQRSLLIIAGEKIPETDKSAFACIVLGNGSLNIKNLIVAMREKEIRELFRTAGKMAGIDESVPMEDIQQLRRETRKYYWLSVLAGAWSVVLIALTITGFFKVSVTLSCMLVMTYLGFLLWGEIGNRHRKMKKILQQQIEDTNQQLRAFHAMLSQLKERQKEDGDDED